jgi:predicted metal-dependent enzyme (double-stranded beta helix superfamily)
LNDKPGGDGTNQYSNVNKSENVNGKHGKGNSTTYRIAKLKRDHPAIADRLAAAGVLPMSIGPK